MNITESKAGKTTISYQPINDYILVDPKFKETTESGIVIPEQLQDQTKDMFAEVVAVGADVKYISIGDFVNAASHARPTTIEIDSKKFVQIKEYEVMGKKLN